MEEPRAKTANIVASKAAQDIANHYGCPPIGEDLSWMTARIDDALSQEREACAQVAEKKATDHDFYDGGYEVGKKIAAEIRARGDLKG